MQNIKVQAKLLSAESKPYSVDGNTGTSHKLRFNVDGEIFVFKSDEDQVKELVDSVGTEGDLTFSIVSRKENMSLKCVSFE
jgi:alpha-L-fucosidase